MRIALISDIHGNLAALDAVLGEIAAEGLERIICLGDVASDGPQPVEVLERLTALQCPVVMGNADAEVVGLIPLSDAPDMPMVAQAALWCAERIGAYGRALIAAFQPHIEDTAEGWPLLFFHGAPKDFNRRLLPTTPDNSVRQALAGCSAELMAGGHTHLQMLRRIDQTVLINPGSVGMAYDRASEDAEFAAWAEYAVLTLTADAFRAKFRRTVFDREAHLSAIRTSGMPNADFWAAAWSRATRLRPGSPAN